MFMHMHNISLGSANAKQKATPKQVELTAYPPQEKESRSGELEYTFTSENYEKNQANTHAGGNRRS